MLLCQVEAFYLSTKGWTNVCNGLISDDDDDDEVVVGGSCFQLFKNLYSRCRLQAGRVGFVELLFRNVYAGHLLIS